MTRKPLLPAAAALALASPAWAAPGDIVAYITYGPLSAGAQAIPTLSQWGLAALVLALAVLAPRLLRSARGGSVETAVIAGTMAGKRTHELIPFCHPLPIGGCRFGIAWDGDSALKIECAVKTTHRTGVEMEALTGVSTALLTIYDMCKAMDRGMVIRDIHILEKDGGKSGHYIYQKEEK